MKTKKITLLISILFTFVIFAVPAFAGVDDPDTPTFWWDINNDGEPDTSVFLEAGQTLEAFLYLSGVPEEDGLTSAEGNVRYTNLDMFNNPNPDLSDGHLNFYFEAMRGESVVPGDFYFGGGYIFDEVLYGDNNLILGEYDVLGVPGLDWVGIRLTATENIDPYANITLDTDFELLHGDQPVAHDFSTYALTINPVSVPAAVWLIGSAMLGILGINRRKKN